MEWEWEPEPQALGALGLAGICRETSRVVRRAILPNFANWAPPLLSALLLAYAAALRALSKRIASHIDDGTSLLHDMVPCYLLGIIILVLCRHCTTAYVLCVASLYRTGGDLLAADRVVKEGLPVAPLMQLAFPVLLLTVTADLLRLQAETVLPLPLLAWAGAPYVALVCQLAWVVSVLEDASLFSALRRSHELLARKIWAAACVFVTLDGCIFAVLKAFPALVMDDSLGLGLAFQVAAGAAMVLAL